MSPRRSLASRALRVVAIVRVQLRASLLQAMQYRLDFLFDGASELLNVAVGVAPLLVVLQGGRSIGGYGRGEALVVMAFFVLQQALIEGVISPSLSSLVEHVRKGTLDFVLLKPADAQLLVSTSRFSPWRIVNVLTAVGIGMHAFGLLGRSPTAGEMARAALALAAGSTTLYALFVLVASVAFYAVRVDNLMFLLGSIFDAARWPATVWKGALRYLFTFVIPLAVMTTFPADALLGRMGTATLAATLVGSALFAAVARRVFLRAIASYTSAA